MDTRMEQILKQEGAKELVRYRLQNRQTWVRFETWPALQSNLEPNDNLLNLKYTVSDLLGHNCPPNPQLQGYTDDCNVIHLDGQMMQYWVHGTIKESNDNLLIPTKIIERNGRIYDKTLNQFCNGLYWVLPMHRMIVNYCTSQNWSCSSAE